MTDPDAAAITTLLTPSDFTGPSPVSGPVSLLHTTDTRSRLRIIEGAVMVFRRFAFHEATFDLVATNAHVTVAEVTQHFPTWESLLVATINYWNGQRMRPILPIAARAGAAAFLRGIVQANIDDPALMRWPCPRLVDTGLCGLG